MLIKVEIYFNWCNNMFHVIDITQRLNTQIIIDDVNEKLMNYNL